jgi:hypothetical protein
MATNYSFTRSLLHYTIGHCRIVVIDHHTNTSHPGAVFAPHHSFGRSIVVHRLLLVFPVWPTLRPCMGEKGQYT